MVKKKEDKTFESPEEFEEFMSEEPEEVPQGPSVENGGEPEEASLESSPEDDFEDDIEIPERENEKLEDMLDIAADVPVQVVAVMGKKNVTMKELASMRMGEVIELARPANEVVDLIAGGKLIAKGELVEIEGKLGVRIVKMVR